MPFVGKPSDVNYEWNRDNPHKPEREMQQQHMFKVLPFLSRICRERERKRERERVRERERKREVSLTGAFDHLVQRFVEKYILVHSALLIILKAFFLN